jgi:prepilin-type N-terminal cleavage/methylation domain-containing protein
MQYKTHRGFSLIEVIVAIFLVGLMIILVVTVAQNIPILEHVKDQDIALKAAQNELELLRAGGYDALPASGSFASTLVSTLPSGSGALTVTDFNAKTRQVVATVTWRESGAASNSTLSVATLITKIGGL